MKKPASTWPTAVPTSVTRLRMPLSPDCSLIASWMLLRYVVDLRVAGVQRPVAQPVLDLLEAGHGLVGQVGGAVGDLLAGELSSAATERDRARARPGSTAMLRRTPMRTSQSTTGTTSAEMSSATTTGMTITARNEIR